MLHLSQTIFEMMAELALNILKPFLPCSARIGKSGPSPDLSVRREREEGTNLGSGVTRPPAVQMPLASKMSRLVILAAILIFCFHGDFTAQAESIGEIEKEAKAISNKIRKSKAQVRTFTKKEGEIIESLNKTDRELNKSRKRVTAVRSEIGALEKKIKANKAASESLLKQIRVSEAYTSQRLKALYKLSHLGNMPVLASADSIADFFQRKIALERILAYDEAVLARFAEDKAALVKTLAALETQKDKKRSLETEHKKQVRVVSRKKARRSELLSDIRSKKSLALASVKSLKKAAAELDEKIRMLTQEQSEADPGEKMTSTKFNSSKGLLKMPVKGKIISFFGPYKNTEFNVKNFQKGIDIKAGKGQPVRAVRKGKIIFSSWFKGYGNMIIIDHGDRFHTLYAHAEEIFKAKGEYVEAGEVIATVGDTGSMKGPGLHFEIRHHGKAVNPMKWLKKG